MDNINAETKKWAVDVIRQNLTQRGFGSNFLHRLNYNYENKFDFIYGHKTGLIMGLIFGHYIAKFGEEPKEPELADIISLIMMHIDQIKESSKDFK